MQMIEKMGGLAVSLILAAGALLILWKLIRKMALNNDPSGKRGGVGAGDGRGGLIDDLEETDESKAQDIRQMKLQKKLDDISKSDPDDIARIINAWMREA